MPATQNKTDIKIYPYFAILINVTERVCIIIPPFHPKDTHERK